MIFVETLKTTVSVRHRVAIASTAALVAAGVAAATLPSSVFQASAIVAVDEPSAALRLAAARSAADLAVSKPVIARAAASLNGTTLPAPDPALAERLGVAAGLVGATGAVARLADALVPTVGAVAGDGLVEVRARATDATRAAHVATALAEALIAEAESSVLADAGRRDLSTGARLEGLRETARIAHARLVALGGSETDPAEALATAAATARGAETRLAAVHAVIAAGTPPLGAGSELPQSAATLQQTFWDLKKQLDKASESLGERHTTVIALRDGVSKAAATLTAEWQRIERAAAGEVTVARSREAVLRKTSTVADPARRAVLDEARGAARLADAALVRAAAAPAATALVTPPFRLVAPAGVPAAAAGLGPWQRGALEGGVGFGAFALAWLATRRRHGWAFATASRDEAAAEVASAVPHEAATGMTEVPPAKEAKTPSLRPRLIVPLVAIDDARFEAVEPRQPVAVAEAPEIDISVVEPAHDHDEADYDYFASYPDHEPFADEEIAAMPFEASTFDDEPNVPDEAHRGSAVVRALDPDLRDALRAVAAGLETIASGRMATVMVAANAAGADTGTVALALGEAAAELGYRVLVIEGEHARPTLAEAVAPDGEPLLVDAFGALRVALPAERCGGLFLSPALRDGARIAAALARNTQAELVDDLAVAFDAVVIDGSRAADAAAAGWSADAFIRVGRFASLKDDAHLLNAFDAPPEALLGTVAAGRFVVREEVPEARVSPRPVLRPVPASLDATTPRRTTATPPSPLRAPTRRRLVAR